MRFVDQREPDSWIEGCRGRVLSLIDTYNVDGLAVCRAKSSEWAWRIYIRTTKKTRTWKDCCAGGWVAMGEGDKRQLPLRILVIFCGRWEQTAGVRERWVCLIWWLSSHAREEEFFCVVFYEDGHNLFSGFDWGQNLRIKLAGEVGSVLLLRRICIPTGWWIM